MLGIIGCGLLGSALAERLVQAGFSVAGHDVSSARLEALRGLGGQPRLSARQVAVDCRRVVLSLPSSDQVEAVLAEMAAVLRPGQLVIDTTTGEPARVAALGRRLAAAGIEYLDATVSGSSASVLAGQAVVMAGGSRAAFEAAVDLFACFAKNWFHLGEWGSGTRMKLISNLVLGLNRAALAEGLSLAGALGLHLPTVLEVLQAGAAYSRAMDAKGRKMIEGDFEPQARLAQHLKDVRLILAAAEEASASTPLSGLHRQLLEKLVEAGYGECDNAAIIKAFESAGTGR